MDAKTVTPETTPYASDPSDKARASAAAIGADSGSSEGRYVNGEEFDTSPAKPKDVATEYVGENSEKGSVGAVDNSVPLVSPTPESVRGTEGLPNSEVGDGGVISGEDIHPGGDSSSPDATSSLSPTPKGFSDEKEGVRASEGKGTVEADRLENGGVDVGQNEASPKEVLDERSVSDEIEQQKVGEMENEVEGFEAEGLKNDVTKEDGSVIDSGTNESGSVSNGEAGEYHDGDQSTEGDGVKMTDKGDSIVDSFTMESVLVDVAKPSVAVVGDVEGNEEMEVKERAVETGESNDNVDEKFDQIGHEEGGGNELQSDNPTGEAAVDSVNADDVVKLSPNIGDPAYDGKSEQAAKDTVDATKVEHDGQKADGNGLTAEPEEEEAHDAESSDVSSSNKEEKSLAAAESGFQAEANADVKEVFPKEEASGGDGDKIRPEDMVFMREYSTEGKKVDKQPADQGAVGDDGSDSGGETEEMIFGSSEAAKQFLEELEKASSGIGAHNGKANISNSQSPMIDGQIVTDSDEEVDTDDEGEEKPFDSTALAALLKAAAGGSSEGGGNFTITSQDGSRLFSVERPVGLGSSLPSVRAAAPRPNRSNIFSHPNVTADGESESNLSEEDKKKLEKLQNLRVKFLRLLHKLGHSAEDSIAAQVLYRLALLAGRQTGQLFSLDAAKRTAMELEAEGKDDLNFSLNILVLGKAGVGKSATINSILSDQKASIDAFGPATISAREISGTVDGVKVTVIDTPGLKSSAMEQSANRKLLSSVKKLTKKCPPDIVLYVDRLDAQTRDLNDLPLLRTITSTLGSSVWKNAIVTLTHAASAPPDGPSGSPLSYDVFVAQRSHVVQQSIGQAVGDLRLMNPSLMNPVSLVENHPLCRKNRDGEKVLPNGQTWRPQLLLLSYSLKILSEANSLLKPQEPLDHRRLFGFRVRSPPLPYLLSWLLQSRAHPKLSADQGGDAVDSDVELDDVSDSEQEDNVDDEYDQLPPFKPLRRAQLAKLTKEQKKAYFEEYDYRVKLLQKKQWREELRRMREMKKKGKKSGESSEYGYLGEEEDPENGAPAAVPVPLPDMVLPPSFDGDNPAYRYRFLEPTSQLLTRPVLDTHGWDHDCGYDGVNVEHSLAIASRFPAAVTVQVTKDKKEFNIHMDSSVAMKHGENGSTMAGFDIQNVGKQLAYVVRGETKFKNLKKNKTTLGGSVTFLGENVATGVKLEDQVAIGKRLVLVGSTGTVRSRSDSAYGANLEIRLREADFPIGQDQSSLGLSLVKWRGDLALGANLQSQVSVGRQSKIAVRAGLNNKRSGQISVRTSSSDQLQIALAGILPIAMAIYKHLRPGGTSDKYSMY